MDERSVMALEASVGAAQVTELMQRRCGVFGPEGSCQCERRVLTATARGHLVPGRWLFATSTEQVREFLAPVEVAGLTGVTKLLAAGANTCLLTGGGGLLCWGSNRYGQLGDGTGGNPNDERAQPAAVLGLGSGVTSAASGSIFGLAVIDGAVRMWGSFRAEELEPIAAPAFPAPVTAIAAGQSSERGYGCGITDKGTYCWGDNSGGVVGPYESEDGQYFEDEPLPVSSLD